MADYRGVKLYDTMYKEYGPIAKVKVHFGSPDMVLLFDPKATEYVLRSEDRMPIRPEFESLAYYRKHHNKTFDAKKLTGLITDHGENWKVFRIKVNPVMLQPKTIKIYADILEKVANDMQHGCDRIRPPIYMSVMEQHYPKPDEFIPERWQVDKNDPLYHGNSNPFVNSPFGFGVRMCIGRRIAELELETFISKMMENFQVQWKGGPIQVTPTSINYLTGPFNFVFTDL